MSGALGSVILLAGMVGIGWFIVTQTDLLKGINLGSIVNPTATTPSAGGGGTAKSGKMIYNGTGKVLTGDLAVLDAHKNQSLDSGGTRPSTRFIWGSGKGKGAAKCMDYNSYEATVYAKLGPGGSSNTRAIVTGGGGGQRGSNCCVYSVGFVTSTGAAFAEEEGAHEPHPTIEKMPVVGGAVNNIGPLAGRTIGFKEILIRNAGKVLLEGWVDSENNGNWRLFYRANNPHGGNLPVITKTGLVGEQCGEVRFRCDDIWPVTIDIARSFIAELPDNTAGGAVTSAVGTGTPPNPVQTAEAKKAPAKAKAKTKKANFASSQEGEGFKYLEHSPTAILCYPYYI